MSVVFKTNIDDTPGAETPYVGAYSAFGGGDKAMAGKFVNIRIVGDSSDTPLNDVDGVQLTYYAQIDLDGELPLRSVRFTPNTDYTWQWDNVMIPDIQVTAVKLYQGDPAFPDDATLVATDD